MKLSCINTLLHVHYSSDIRFFWSKDADIRTLETEGYIFIKEKGKSVSEYSLTEKGKAFLKVLTVVSAPMPKITWVTGTQPPPGIEAKSVAALLLLSETGEFYTDDPHTFSAMIDWEFIKPPVHDCHYEKSDITPKGWKFIADLMTTPEPVFTETFLIGIDR